MTDFARVPIFEGLLKSEVDRLIGAAARRTLGPGEVLFREEDPGGDLFVVDEGIVEIRIRVPSGEITLVSLGPGEVIGEVSLVDDGARSAEAQAKTQVRLFCWGKETIRKIFEDEPRIGYVISSNLGRIIARRVRSANALLLYRS